MPMKVHSLAAVGALLCLAASLTAQARTYPVVVEVRIEKNGEASILVWPQKEGVDFTAAVSEAANCLGGFKRETEGVGRFHCANLLSRDGLSLKAQVNLAPIAERLDPTDQVQLRLSFPQLGYESVSLPMEVDSGWSYRIRTAEFTAANPPPPIGIEYGYRPGGLTAIYLPLAAFALALAAIAALLSRAGLAALNLSAFLLGTMFWMGLAARLQAAEPLRILLYQTWFAGIASIFVTMIPPLFCIAAGVALGNSKRTGREPGDLFSEVMWGYGIFLLPMTCTVGALPSIHTENWAGVAGWVVAAPLFVILCRWRIRAAKGSSVRQVAGGELQQRISAMAARIGRPKVKVFVTFSARSQAPNAFALPGRSIYFTAPLIRSFSKREVHAVAAHELAHFGLASTRPWIALAIAMVLFETPVTDLLPSDSGWFLAIMLVPLFVYFTALGVSRKREFAADAGSAVLGGDPRGLISALARISRAGNRPLKVSPLVEWFSSHPSTHKRVQALARTGGVGQAELETLCTVDDPGEHYELPAEESGPLFTPAWQKINSGIYGWAVLFSSCGAALVVAWLVARYAGAGVVQFVAGIALAYLIVKALAGAASAGNYARLGRKLAAKLGVSGQVVGFAPDGEFRLYGGYRFAQIGLLRFENGRLCYRSESTGLAINPADVVEVGMVAAAPAAWFQGQPMVRFRCPSSSEPRAFILQPLAWIPSQRRLFRSIERWRAPQTTPETVESEAAGAEATTATGFDPVASQPVNTKFAAQLARAAFIYGGITLVLALPIGWLLRAPWWYAVYALALAVSTSIFTFLPILFYRTPASPAESASPASAT
jgi:heat shock protein HtpX